MIRGETIVNLPGGVWCDGQRHQEAVLRPMVGEDEAAALQSRSTLLPAQWATALLARCVTRLGPLNAIKPQTIRLLTVGDREALLLHLRRLELGDRLACVVRCPDGECEEPMDVELKVSDLLLPPYPHAEDLYERVIQENGIAYQVRFHVPTGSDQEVAAGMVRDDPEGAVQLLLQRCVESVVKAGEKTEPVEELPTVLARQLPGVMAELDPQAELILNLKCPSCGHGFSTHLDAADFFFRELAGRASHLELEVHLLAFYYSWSEAEILALPSRRRRRYVDILTSALKGNGAG